MSGNRVQSHRIKYGEKVITFDLEFRQRKTLEISVFPDLSVRVKAPVERNIDEVLAKVRKRASWILEQKYFFSLFLPNFPPRKYISGETHFYLGKQYRLKVNKSDEEDVLLRRGILQVFTDNRNISSRIKFLLEDWYKNRAQVKFVERLDICYDKVRKYGFAKPKLQIRNMAKRWGSCSPTGKMILNTHLIKASSYCIDYVIMHELCHLIHQNHSRAFYRLLTRILPDWETRKKRLDRILI